MIVILNMKLRRDNKNTVMLYFSTAGKNVEFVLKDSRDRYSLKGSSAGEQERDPSIPQKSAW